MDDLTALSTGAAGTCPPVPVPRRLLIVQRNAAAARSMARYLQRHFDSVQVLETWTEVEAALLDRRFPPTHLISGQDLGEGSPTGASLIPRWRQLCPALECVVLATGVVELPAELPGVDAVFHKPAQPAELLSLLAA